MRWPRRSGGTPGLVRDTFRHAAIYSGAGMLGRVIGFFMLPLYAHALRDIGYGVIGMVETGLTLLASLLAYNLNTAIVRMYHEQQDPSRKPLVVSTAVVLVVAVALPMALLGASVSRPAAAFMLGDAGLWSVICLALGAFVLDLVNTTVLSFLTVTRRSGIYSALSLVRLFTSVSMNVLFIVILDWGVHGYFMSSLVTALVMNVISVVVVGRYCPPRFDRAIAKDLIDFQLPLVPGAMTRYVSNQIERILVRFQIDIASLGVLEMAYRFPGLITMLLVTPFQQSWGTKRMEIAGEPGAEQHIGRMFVYFVFLSVFAFLLLAVNIDSVLRVMTPREFWAAGSIAKVEAAQIVTKAAMAHLAFGLMYAKRTDLLARAMIVTSIVKVGLSYVMISVWGLSGAAWSGLVITFVYGLWAWQMGWRFYRFPLAWGKLTLIGSTAVAIMVVDARMPLDTVAQWGAPVVDAMQSAVRALGPTWIGTWKDGRLIQILVDRAPEVFDLTVRTAGACLFLLLLPLVHHETGERIVARMRAARAGGRS